MQHDNDLMHLYVLVTNCETLGYKKSLSAAHGGNTIRLLNLDGQLLIYLGVQLYMNIFFLDPLKLYFSVERTTTFL